uniref:ribosomal protein S9 n=1 Tax=Gayralia brasiliensis TaxID=1286870 RepID=UPI002410FB7C|nr:ribosomal protein S9 [Gayralia brasiliensis]YP_010733763.1 ribosomal protein S9 [Monostroma nitidum]WEG92960.1 ribosomal protein S9 [Gayralia brasiliensis]WEG93034.1 ribosomal protein S9 [Monostroma nitidum]
MENSQTKTGRHKKSIATVQLIRGNGEFTINGLSGIDYMQQKEDLIFAMQEPLTFLNLKKELDVDIKVKGGGLVGQVNAIRLGIARALCELDLAHRSPLKLKGLLTRDSRCKERKKYGLKKARKAPQFSKR